MLLCLLYKILLCLLLLLCDGIDIYTELLYHLLQLFEFRVLYIGVAGSHIHCTLCSHSMVCRICKVYFRQRVP